MAYSNFAHANLPGIQIPIELILEGWVNVSSAGSGAWTIEPGDWSDLGRFGHGETSNDNIKTVDLIREVEIPPGKVVTSSVPPSQVAATVVPMQLEVDVRLTGTPAGVATLDAQVFLSTRNGGVNTSIGTSGDLVTTSPVDLKGVSANTWQTVTFVIDADDLTADLIVGDAKLNVAIRAVNNDSGGTGGGRVEIGGTRLKLYTHGGHR